MTSSDALHDLLKKMEPSMLSTLLATVNFSNTNTVSTPRLVITDAPRGKLCLNMIVKNESKIITRLFDSVVNIIDSYCICDTGSTDNTADIIREYMSKAGKKGEVYLEPFQNFGYNRTHALERANQWAEYAILLDADMVLSVQPEFNTSLLTDYAYTILQKNSDIEYYNTRLVKTGVGIRCVGPTHEYYDIPQGRSTDPIKSLCINDIGDGGAKGDKFERDVRLLTKGLEAEPKNERYMFYLANSLRDLGRTQEAIEWYKKRFEAGGWIEETFYAAYELGKQYAHLKDMPNAVYWWIEAYNKHPSRAESLYEIVKYYRESGKNHAGQMICNMARAIPYPKNDVLFIKHAVYDHLLDYEHSILAYYTKARIDHYAYLALIGKGHNKINTLANYIFYVHKLAELKGVTVHDFGGKADKFIGGRSDNFTSSSPCILSHKDGYLLNVRYVNYTIRDDGSYNFKHSDGKITTINRVYTLDTNLSITSDKWLDDVERTDLRYQGVEDVKVFQDKDTLLFLGTVEHPQTGAITVGHGTYDMSLNLLKSEAFTSPAGRSCEKNWCYFHDAHGDRRVVYDWSPLTIGVDSGNRLMIQKKDTNVPQFFSDVRGSSNGTRVGDELWFLCHIANYTTPRTYYHVIVILDINTLAYKKHSILFKFNSDCIEYALGLVVETERILISYSRMDRTSAVIVVPRSLVESVLFRADNS